MVPQNWIVPYCPDPRLEKLKKYQDIDNRVFSG